MCPCNGREAFVRTAEFWPEERGQPAGEPTAPPRTPAAAVLLAGGALQLPVSAGNVHGKGKPALYGRAWGHAVSWAALAASVPRCGSGDVSEHGLCSAPAACSQACLGVLQLSITVFGNKAPRVRGA